MKYYSATTKGFYDTVLHREDQIPSDSVTVADNEYDALMNAQANGKVISNDSDGNPVASH